VHANSTPLTLRQLYALATAATRQLAWASGAVAKETRAWLARATAIPDAPIRRDAVNALKRKRGHTDGAALFCTIPAHRSRTLLRLLVAYEIMWDYLDSVNERGAFAGVQNGRQLHRALVDALDPRLPLSDYYRFHPWCNDGGYLRALVDVCRRACVALPSYASLHPLVLCETLRVEVLAINHDLDAGRRDAGLRDWAARDVGERRQVAWFESSGAASASTTIHALLALAAQRACRPEDAQRTQRAYYPWISVATTMLDSYVDQFDDMFSGDHSYVGHYPTPVARLTRLQTLIRRSMEEALLLPDGERHALIVACMVAMYLSKDSSRSRTLRASSMSLAGAGGSLTVLLLPVLRIWRIAHAQRRY
jgi:tetraprenyl-beta-curcumene synthase